MDKAWEMGVPHIIFTGGEPTSAKDLPELIAHAEHNGQITGLNTNARRLSDAALCRQSWWQPGWTMSRSRSSRARLRSTTRWCGRKAPSRRPSKV